MTIHNTGFHFSTAGFVSERNSFVHPLRACVLITILRSLKADIMKPLQEKSSSVHSKFCNCFWYYELFHPILGTLVTVPSEFTNTRTLSVLGSALHVDPSGNT